MKNLLVYINPRKDFDDNYNDRRLAEVQIENSLLFSKPEDILLVTNFPYEYRGVEALVVDDQLFCEADPTGKASKVNVIVHLLEKGLLPELTWFHDLDAFQLAPINLELKKDLGLTRYGYKENWNTGSFFFKPSALDVFRWLKNEVYKRKANEEPVLWILTKQNFNQINSRYQVLNNTYNVGMRKTDQVISLSEKPIRVAHFPPHSPKTFAMFKPILTENLIRTIEEKYYPNKIKPTPLCKLAFKYGTDKCPQIGHDYTPIFYNLFKKRRKTIKKVLEIGIGSRKTMSRVPEQYQKGASLLMWRDFFPKAQIYGIDIHPSAIFQSERIKTFCLDYRHRSHLRKVIQKIGSDIDLVIDDGNHQAVWQIRTAQALMPLLKQDCLYIIEDTRSPDHFKPYFSQYDCQVFKLGDHYKTGQGFVSKNNLVVLRKK